MTVSYVCVCPRPNKIQTITYFLFFFLRHFVSNARTCYDDMFLLSKESFIIYRLSSSLDTTICMSSPLLTSPPPPLALFSFRLPVIPSQGSTR